MKFILIAYFTLFSIVISAQCTGFPATIADDDCGLYTVLTNNSTINSGQTLGACNSSMTFNSFTGLGLNGGVIRVCGNTRLSGTFNSGTIVVACGATLDFPTGLVLNQNIGIINYGTVTVTGDIVYQNSNNHFYNESSTSRLYVSGDIVYPQNNGQNAYLKNNGYISIGGDFNAYEGGFTCLGSGSSLICNNIRYLNNCGNASTNNRFTYSGGSSNAIVQYTGSATIKANFTGSSSIDIYSTVGATAINNGGCGTGSWGSATVTTNTSTIPNPTEPDPATCPIPNCFSTLPIILVDFIVKLETDRVRLDWVTSSEINNDFFTIERSGDGINWEIVERINGAGNSNQLLNYTSYDFNPLAGTSYYRLKQTDFDNRYTYSSIRSVNNYNDVQYFNIYPNPANNKITVSGEAIEIELINLLGEVVFKQKLTSKEEDIILSELPSGTYMVRIIRNQDTFIKKIMLQN